MDEHSGDNSKRKTPCVFLHTRIKNRRISVKKDVKRQKQKNISYNRRKKSKTAEYQLQYMNTNKTEEYKL